MIAKGEVGNPRGSLQEPEPRIKTEIGSFDLVGRKFQIMLVDGVIPTHSRTRGNKGIRLTYAEGEIAHFEFEGHRYSVVTADLRRRSADSPDDDAYGTPGCLTKTLSSRELQIVQLLCMGLLTKQVAHRLRISEFTVRTYLKAIYAKLGVRSRASLVFEYMKKFRASGN